MNSRSFPMSAACLFLVLGLAAAGCTPSRNVPECTADTDCPDGQRCLASLCRVPEACEVDEDCTAPVPYCEPISGTCVVCTADEHCSLDQICDGGDCRPRPPCQADDDCERGQICDEELCVAGCRSDRDCPIDWTCLPEIGDHGTCAQCEQDSDCPPATRCQDYLCVFFCTSDLQCAPFICDEASGTCVDCTADEHCPAGEICRNQACVSGCRSDSDCPDGRCDMTSRACVDCLASDDCPLGHLCQDQACVSGCNSDRDCPAGLRCAADLGPHGTCVECLLDGDCPTGELCLANSCVLRCSTSDDCAAPNPVCDPALGACVQCLIKDDCPLGHLCRDRVCVEGCESDRDCPDELECRGGTCQAACVPSGAEVCNGLDDDCDGRTDGTDPQLVLAACELRAGVCSSAVHRAEQCQTGGWVPCTAAEYGPEFGDEICDGLDSDCDGFGDEGLALDCPSGQVCSGGECVAAGGCTNECQSGQTDCTWWDQSIIYTCGNTDADPCLEWVQDACPANSFCDALITNKCLCDYEQCGESCCSADQVCHATSGACCTPSCPARTCGADGCGGTCECDLANDQCLAGVCTCQPSCAGKECGSDGCTGSCPDTCADIEHCEDNRCLCDYAECGGVCCPQGQVCNSSTSACCTPQCTNKECGPDGCGHTCGSCLSNERCEDGLCVCVPACGGAVCGSDGCGGSCGSCPTGQRCNTSTGQCCTPQCGGRECGPDGCGGSCGSCGENEACQESTGQCTCAYETCGGTCCPSGQVCFDGDCCTPSCGDGLYTAFHCGADGCGDTCDCQENYGPGAGCNSSQECTCPSPGFTCQYMLFYSMCCSSTQTCDSWIGCY